MASYNTSEFRGGLKIIIDGDPCAIMENEFVKPGKGQAREACASSSLFSRVQNRCWNLPRTCA